MVSIIIFTSFVELKKSGKSYVKNQNLKFLATRSKLKSFKSAKSFENISQKKLQKSLKTHIKFQQNQ